MKQAELLTALAGDPNWETDFHTENFQVFSRRQVLTAGKASVPLRGITGRLSHVPLSAGFHGLSNLAFDKIKELVTHIDRTYFFGRTFPHRKSKRPIPVVLWDASYPRPLSDQVSSVKRASLSRTPADDPETIPNENASASSDAADYFILVPVPNRYYWGEVRPEWLCGAIAHEMCHVWSAWLGPPDLASFLDGSPWRVLDEMLAVWAERAWTPSACRSALEYAADWTLQSGVSLYGAEAVKGVFQSDCGFGYHQWPFIFWLEAKFPNVMEQMLLEAAKGQERDPWHCLDRVIQSLAKGNSLAKVHAEYAAAAFTSSFLDEHFTQQDAQWYLKSVEEVLVIDAQTNELTMSGQVLFPLSKRAFLLRNAGDLSRKFEITLQVSGDANDYGLHLVEEDGNGTRVAVLKQTDLVHPYVLEFSGAAQVIIVVSCSRLNEMRKSPLGASQDLSAHGFSLHILTL